MGIWGPTDIQKNGNIEALADYGMQLLKNFFLGNKKTRYI
jgi:hypothetical protein